MKRIYKTIKLLLLLLLLPLAIFIHASSASKKDESVQSESCQSNYLTLLMRKLRKGENNKKLDNALQVQSYIKKRRMWEKNALACYIVPAMSAVKRLPDRIPSDCKLDNKIRLIAAKGEFIPASFVIFPFMDFPQVKITASALHGDKGSIPADAVNIKVVKCWYQGGTAWHSYFADSEHRVLVPELLLNDETLIKVDQKTRENYLRIDYPAGSEYLWISYPKQIKGTLNVFNHAKVPVADSPRLKPVELTAGSFKQIWLTIKVPDKINAGYYNGTITIATADKKLGTLDLNLRILPFSLPPPKTYYDLNKDFYTTLYNHSDIRTYHELFGQTDKDAEKKVLSELKNMREHNIISPLVERFMPSTAQQAVRQLELMKEAGLKTNPVFGLMPVFNWELLYKYLRVGKNIPPGKWKQLKEHTETTIKLVQKVFGHTNIYGIGWDEPGRRTLEAQQKLFALLHDKGLNVYETGKDSHLKYAGFNEDIVNYPGHPFNSNSARKWHAMGAKIFSYAGPHTGPENPDFIRRTHGLQLYKSDYDGSANYRYYGYRINIWNDFESENYRICFVYPTSNGVIDTLHWEAFREGIDDIRYATKLRQVAFQAIAAGGAQKRYAGKKALQYLALLDAQKADLNNARLEMINHILRITNLLQGDK